MAACLKHFAANNQETDRQRVSAEVDERTLREIYLRNFQIAIREANPWSVMSAYNKINGVDASENRWLLTDLLRRGVGLRRRRRVGLGCGARPIGSRRGRYRSPDARPPRG